MKTFTIQISERDLSNAHKFLRRSRLEGSEVMEFAAVVKALTPPEAQTVPPAVASAPKSGKK